MITTNVLQRTFQISYGKDMGTGFTIDIDDKQYLVTARHVVSGIQQEDTIRIFHDHTWKNLKVETAWISQSKEDIAILIPEVQLSPNHPLEPSSGGLILGQDVYFCGYPYGLKMEVGYEFNRGFPLPLVKRGTVSSMAPGPLLIDGINNPGFSGGPVVFSEPGSKEFKVAGVISGYRVDYDPVLLKGKDIGLEYGYNTGLIVAYELKNGTDYITP